MTPVSTSTTTLEARAIVVSVDRQLTMVEASQGNGCSQCNGKGCGSGKLSQMFCNKPRQFQVDNPINARVGDEVIVSVAEGALLRGVGLVYLLPLLLLVIGATFGTIAAAQPEQRDGYAAAGALFGLVAGFLFAKWFSLRQNRQQNRPYIARQWREE
jgi:sigma-E factor negative regulatory protein RseC